MSQPPHFFQAGLHFSIKNAKSWPILAHFDQFRLFCCKFTHFLLYFLQAQIVWRCTKIDKYEVCILLWVNTSYFWSCIIVVSSKLSENSDENRCSPSHESTIQVSNTSTSSVPAPVLLSPLFRCGALSIDFSPFPLPDITYAVKRGCFISCT